ncbi:hypothetical protein DVH05_012370 [Phytophthora capsici]|nr:hypothetical protein DVH05_012370 [Phytophthora capsici]
MTSPPSPGAIAFVGPPHLSHLACFGYVEVVRVDGTTAVVREVGPDSPAEDAATEHETPLSTIQFRIVPDHERTWWPGSYVAHPVAFVTPSADGVDHWAYGVVTGYSASETSTILNIISHTGSLRFTMTDRPSIIKVDTLNYALQTSANTNALAISPPELLHFQNGIIAACSKRRTGLPPAIKSQLSVPFNPDELIPLVHPSTLALVRVRRQHALDFAIAPRSKRPIDLYTDPLASTAEPRSANPSARAPSTSVLQHQGATSLQRPPRSVDDSEPDDDDEVAVSDGDIEDIRHQNAPLVKRRRIQHDSDSDDSFEEPMDTLDTQGVTFHPSPVDRRIHATIVHRRHAGKIPQTLLQSVQFAPYVEFLATPAVLRALYSFGFGLGLSVMHCRRRLPADDVEASEHSLNMWDFSGKHSLHAATKPCGYGDLVSALSTLHKFAEQFYNKETSAFIATARDFVISYNDHAAPDGHMARLLAYWVNHKFGIFRSRLASTGIKEALRVGAEFTRSDDMLSALKDSNAVWKRKTQSDKSQSVGRTRPSDRDQHRKPTRTHNPISAEVYEKVP